MVYTGITKAQAFRLYFVQSGIREYLVRQNWITNAVKFVIKDDSEPVALTNTAVFVDEGLFYVDLTADEMNADRIVVYYGPPTVPADAGTTMVFGAVILTATSSGGSSGLSLTDTVTDVEAITETSPTINEVLSLLHTALVKCGNRDGWSFKKWINRFNW